jgi:hypothetical protein
VNEPSAAYTLRDARVAIARERETRHWNIPQWKEASSEEHWPSYIAKVRRLRRTLEEYRDV